jgi:hypothetical protein
MLSKRSVIDTQSWSESCPFPENVHDLLHVAVLKNRPDRQDSDRIRVPLNAALVPGIIMELKWMNLGKCVSSD